MRTASSKFYRWYSEGILMSLHNFETSTSTMPLQEAQNEAVQGCFSESEHWFSCKVSRTLQKALQIFQPVGPSYCLCQSQKRNNNKTNSLNHDLNHKTLWKVLLFTMNKTIFLQFLAWKSNTPKPTRKWEIFSSWRLIWKATLPKALRCFIPFVQILKIDCTQN